MTRSLFAALAAALATTEIGQKLALTATVATDWQAGILDWQDTTPVDLVCGRPPRPGARRAQPSNPKHSATRPTPPAGPRRSAPPR